jgi:Domain of unknown function (DUF1835)
VTTLHITNGDSAAGTLRTFLTDRVVITADPLFEGPAPPLDGDAWHRVRASYLVSEPSDSSEQFVKAIASSDRSIADAGLFDEVVLWFEHDLFDQLLLVRTLALFGTAARAKASLICIDAFPGVERFIGLGQLGGTQLSSLYPTRRKVTPAQFELANRTWRAFRADDPTDLMALGDTSALPFLRGALHRFFEEYPWTTNGLSRTAAAALREAAARPSTGGSLFCASQMQEQRPFMGDLSFFNVIRSLATPRVPLVEIKAGDDTDLGAVTIATTDAGRDVVAGRADAIQLNGIDEWRGGVHLTGRHHSPWRWDPAAQRLVS